MWAPQRPRVGPNLSRSPKRLRFKKIRKVFFIEDYSLVAGAAHRRQGRGGWEGAAGGREGGRRWDRRREEGPSPPSPCLPFPSLPFPPVSSPSCFLPRQSEAAANFQGRRAVTPAVWWWGRCRPGARPTARSRIPQRSALPRSIASLRLLSLSLSVLFLLSLPRALIVATSMNSPRLLGPRVLIFFLCLFLCFR